MSKYCIVCGKNKGIKWDSSFIGQEPLECDECSQKINKTLTKLILKNKRSPSIIIPKDGCVYTGGN
jgi:hypothetical protein